MRVKRTQVVAGKKSEAKSAMDSAVVLAALTGLVYVTAVSYETGYCRYFSIPISLIVPSTSAIVLALLTIVGVGLSVAPFVGIQRLILRETSLPTQFRIRFEMSIWFSLAGLANFGLSWSALASTAFSFFVICGPYLIALLPGRKPLVERIRDIDAEPDHLHEANPATGLFKMIGSTGTVFAMLTLFSSIAAIAVGTVTARIQKDFDVIESRPDVALVRAYGDLMVGVKFDALKKAATGEIVVFKVDDDFKQLNLRSRRIGPLTGEDRQFLDLRDSK